MGRAFFMRLLVVEDSDLLRDSLVQGLREADYAVDASADGTAGLRLAQENVYDVILLDLMLPGMDGLTILRRLRQAQVRASVLVLTARDTPADRATGLDCGADDYLVKPFAFPELLARVRALVRRKLAAKDPTVRVGDLEINTASRLARRSGQTIELSAREYALLEFLARHAGHVVTRAEIWEHVYDFNSDADSNVVDVFIGLLRKKIERPGLPRLVHTHRGQGYLLGEAAAAGAKARADE
jgi:DNA-binding response OmpR family regulator